VTEATAKIIIDCLCIDYYTSDMV